MASILTVTQINTYLSHMFKNDFRLKGIAIKGEISNLTIQSTGHMYFTLKDKDSTIRVVMFSSSASKLRFSPDNSMSVIAMGNIEIYERTGTYQLIVSDLQPYGIGDLYLAFNQLRDKLTSEGLFDLEHKKEIPSFPQKIGVITSQSGAVLHDIINVLERRYPIATVYVFNTPVQGLGAAEQICDGLILADASNLDVLIIARGGGSYEDLSVFNSEEIARTIFSLKTPIISAIGHETDITITDLVSDLRAPTPSAAAEICSESLDNIYSAIDKYEEQLNSMIENKFTALSFKVNNYQSRLKLFSPKNTLNEKNTKLKSTVQALNSVIKNKIDSSSLKLYNYYRILDSLSYKNVLSRGFNIAYKGDLIVSSVQDIKSGEQMDLQFSDGIVQVKVIDKR